MTIYLPLENSTNAAGAFHKTFFAVLVNAWFITTTKLIFYMGIFLIWFRSKNDSQECNIKTEYHWLNLYTYLDRALKFFR